MSTSQRRAEDLHHAHEIQRSFLPPLPEEVPGFRIVAEYWPMGAVGGDFYDLKIGPGRRLLVTLGDVSGKGVSGALWMARVTFDLRHILATRDRPLDIVRELDVSLGALLDGAAAESVAVLCVALDLDAGELRIANAGHLPALLRHDDNVYEVGLPSALPIGLLPFDELAEEVRALELGDLLVLVTDGVTDGLRTASDPLGVEALRHLVAGHDGPDEARQRLRHALRRRVDDCTFLAIQAV